MLCNTNNASIANVKIVVPLKYLSSFWRTLAMPECKKTAMTSEKIYVPVVNISTQDYTKLLQQLKSGFKCNIIWNNYQSKPSKLIFRLSNRFGRKNIIFQK